MKTSVIALTAGFGAFLAIFALSAIEANLSQVALVMAPFGASTVLVFGLPKSPLAQPKNVIWGHLITAAIGIAFVQYLTVTPFTLALATGLAVAAMFLSNTTHPPAGANPMLIMLSGQSWTFLFTPVLLGAILIVVVGKIMQVILKRWCNGEPV
ncbi:HPP family protein [Motilimonas pumila]|uniref:HPP family protein n=1 Tax=Motilimonas pumila TaxID=2303987 RepID=A0A418YGK2_9GAMM|nr:HPP family protein [Motilimonas pumila]RJG48633.1 HPP family protein [Motilimonas pumila]